MQSIPCVDQGNSDRLFFSAASSLITVARLALFLMTGTNADDTVEPYHVLEDVNPVAVIEVDGFGAPTYRTILDAIMIEGG